MVTQLVGAVRDSSRSLKGRPLAIDLTLRSPRVLLIEPPPPPPPHERHRTHPVGEAPGEAEGAVAGAASATATAIAASAGEASGGGGNGGAEAEALVKEGHTANRRGDAAAAQRCFDAAYALDGKPSSSLSAANMVLKQGGPRNGAAAAARYQRLLERRDLSAQQREVATRKLLEATEQLRPAAGRFGAGAEPSAEMDATAAAAADVGASQGELLLRAIVVTLGELRFRNEPLAAATVASASAAPEVRVRV